jgi:hypothetical protein
MVFETLKQGREFRKWVVQKRLNCPSILSIQDDEFMESSGMVKVGGKERDRKIKVTYGTLPPNEEERYLFLKNKIVPTLKELHQNAIAQNKTGSELEQQAILPYTLHYYTCSH